MTGRDDDSTRQPAHVADHAAALWPDPDRTRVMDDSAPPAAPSSGTGTVAMDPTSFAAPPTEAMVSPGAPVQQPATVAMDPTSFAAPPTEAMVARPGEGTVIAELDGVPAPGEVTVARRRRRGSIERARELGRTEEPVPDPVSVNPPPVPVAASPPAVEVARSRGFAGFGAKRSGRSRTRPEPPATPPQPAAPPQPAQPPPPARGLFGRPGPSTSRQEVQPERPARRRGVFGGRARRARTGRDPQVWGPPPRARRRRGCGGCLSRLILLVLLVPALFYGANVVDVWWKGSRDGAVKADAILVMGAAQYDGRPSAVLRSRLDHTVALYKQGIAPRVVVTGGRAPGDRVTEATASVNYLTQRGVPERVILRETRGRSTFESINDAAAFMKPRGINKVVIVSDPYHSARAVGIAREQGLDATASPTSGAGSAGLPTKRVMEEAAVVAVGRVAGYRRATVLAERIQDTAGLAP